MTSPECAKHTPAPQGYTNWHLWAWRMSRRHRQVRCRGCGRYRIWVRFPAQDPPELLSGVP